MFQEDAEPRPQADVPAIFYKAHMAPVADDQCFSGAPTTSFIEEFIKMPLDACEDLPQPHLALNTGLYHHSPFAKGQADGDYAAQCDGAHESGRGLQSTGGSQQHPPGQGHAGYAHRGHGAPQAEGFLVFGQPTYAQKDTVTHGGWAAVPPPARGSMQQQHFASGVSLHDSEHARLVPVQGMDAYGGLVGMGYMPFDRFEAALPFDPASQAPMHPSGSAPGMTAFSHYEPAAQAAGQPASAPMVPLVRTSHVSTSPWESMPCLHYQNSFRSLAAAAPLSAPVGHSLVHHQLAEAHGAEGRLAAGGGAGKAGLRRGKKAGVRAAEQPMSTGSTAASGTDQGPAAVWGKVRRRMSSDFANDEERKNWRRMQNRNAKRRYRERTKAIAASLAAGQEPPAGGKRPAQRGAR